MRSVDLAITAGVAMVVALASPALATDVGPGDVSGTWNLAGSPYIVQGHITVPDSQTLTIDPGVEIRFDGPYALYVDGVIDAQGTVADTIRFTTNTPGTYWAHIELDSASDSGSHFSYCRIEYSDARVNAGRLVVDGGGIHASGYGGVVIEHSTIAHCRAQHGGGIYASGNATISDCAIRFCEADMDNYGTGGGVYLAGVSQILNSTITDNTARFGGGGVVMDVATGIVTGCLIGRNQVIAGHGGGISYDGGNAEVSHNVIFSNTVGPSGYSDGGGLFFWYAELPTTITSNTIVGNSAPRGGGVAYGNSTLTLQNSIIAFNESEATYNITDSTVDFECVCVFENAGDDTLHGTETDCLYEDPLFCDMTAEDFQLCANSACAAPTERLCGAIGALGVGCGSCSSPVQELSWGVIKAMYREGYGLPRP